MNRERRNKLKTIRDRLTDYVDELRDLMGAEQDAYDNLPEALQQGEKGQKMEENVSELDSLSDNLADVAGDINALIGE